MSGSMQSMLLSGTTHVPETVFLDTFTPNGPTNSHVPNFSTLPAGTYNVDGTDFNTIINTNRLIYTYLSGASDYGVATYGQVGFVFAEQRNFELHATLNFGSYSSLAYKALYLLVRRNVGIYGIGIVDSTLTLHGCDSGSFDTSIVIIDNQDTALDILYTDSSVDITIGGLSFSRPRQAPQSPISNDYIKGLYILLAEGPCFVKDLQIIA